jgi:hypothetical protein
MQNLEFGPYDDSDKLLLRMMISIFFYFDAC